MIENKEYGHSCSCYHFFHNKAKEEQETLATCPIKEYSITFSKALRNLKLTTAISVICYIIVLELVTILLSCIMNGPRNTL